MNVLCLKLRARKSWAPPPAAPKAPVNTVSRNKTDKMSPPLQITEDTPPDMLAGSMDLCVMLPSGHNVKMSVERSTPMMDLLVQVTTANKIPPAGHVIQAMGDRGVMPYKPSTPIGALDTWTIHIVPKNQSGLPRKASYKPVNQPFEQTFRLQVHLPRNQLYVTRISPKTRLSDILIQVCSEKNLDSTRYSLRHPVNLDQVLNLSCCLADYKLQEIALVSNRTRPLGVSSVDIMTLQHSDPNSQYNFNMSRNNRSCEGSLSSGSLGGRSLSPTRSDGSSASPPPAPPPNRPLRKRRPAPKPPTSTQNDNANNNITTNNNNNNINNNENNNNNVEQQQSSGQCPQSSTVICHSRNSSDSSGYHEASVLSESPESNSLPDSLPRRSKLPSNSSSTEPSTTKVASSLSRSLSNLTTAVGSSTARNMKTHSTSSMSLMSIGRKKKAAPLPPSLKSKMSSVSEETQKQQRTPSVCSNSSSTGTLEENETNLPRKSSTLPASIRVASVTENSNISEIPTEIHQSKPLVEEDPCSSLDLLQNTPSVEQPKPKPRTVFRKDSVNSDCTEPTVGDGSESATNSTTTSTTVNRTLPRKSRKSYPAPAPKPRSILDVSTSLPTRLSSSSTVDQVNKVGSSVNSEDLISENAQSVTVNTKERTEIELLTVNSEKETEKESKDETDESKSTKSIDEESMVTCSSGDDFVSISESDILTPLSSSSSVFFKPEAPEVKPKLKDSTSDISLTPKVPSPPKGRNFSVGNLEDVPAFLTASPQLGRWKNMECLVENCSNACGNGSNTEPDSEQKTNSSSELRLDDDEIDRIFHNAMRDHTSLESGMGDEPPLSLLSLPSPPSSLTNRPDLPASTNTDSLDWEYRLPAPPTFRDEMNSPTVTEFDTVTIGNLTEVFGPESMLQTGKNKTPDKVVKIEPDLVNTDETKNKPIKDDSQESSKQTQQELVLPKPVENPVNDNNKEILVKKKSSTVLITNDCTKPDLLKHSLEEGRKHSQSSDSEKSAVMNELSLLINERRTSKAESAPTEIENPIKTKTSSTDFQTSSALDNFVITTYKETKPLEVFEDDSVKSSNGERRDTSRNEAMFRAPKSIPRRYEPNLKRRSSFSNEDKPSNVTVKRSVSHVSLLAGNVSRGLYRAYARSNSALTETSCLRQQIQDQDETGSRLRKTTSEVNISQGNEGESKINDWRNNDSVGLQSLQVLRSILPQLSHSQGSVDSIDSTENEDKNERVASDSTKKFECSNSEEGTVDNSTNSTLSTSVNKRYSYSGPPTINLGTWNERPKRQVSIKTDRDYCSGFGKLKMSHSLEDNETKDSSKSGETTNDKLMRLVSNSNSRFEDKPDIIKHSSDLSHVPIVRAVELKKPYTTSNVDTTDFGRCGFYNGRSYENLNYIENDIRPKQYNKANDTSTVLSPTSQSSSGLITSKASSKSQQDIDCEEKYRGVNSIAKKFGQQKARPVSCYLFGATDQQYIKNDENSSKPANTSRVLLNSEKKFTSVIGINSTDNKSEVNIVQKPKQQTSKVTIGGVVPPNKPIGFKLNGNVCNKTVENVNSSEVVRAQSKLSSGGYFEDTPKVPSYGNRLVHTPSLKQTNSFMPVVKGFRKPETSQSSLTQSSSSSSVSSGGIPPPPPVIPILKPVGERKQIKTLPLPKADPRDQLLDAIRNFGGANCLKKVSTK